MGLIDYWSVREAVREIISMSVMQVVTCVFSMKNVTEIVSYHRSAVIVMDYVNEADVVH